jgi:hypothetical protein
MTMRITAASMLMATMIATPATAHVDCGDPGQDPCTGSVPTVDQVVGIMQQLTDPNVPAADKGNIVTPGFNPDEAGTIDDHLSRMRAYTLTSLLPPNFVVTDIQPAPNNSAGATVATTGGIKHAIGPRPIVLINQGGHWLIANDAAMTVLDALWDAAEREGTRVRHPHLACGMR